MDDHHESVNVADTDVVRSTQFQDDFTRGAFRPAHAQPQRFDQAQTFNMPHSAGYHQSQSTIHWQTVQPVLGTPAGPQQPMHNPSIGTPYASTNSYNNQVSYSPQPRESHNDGTSNNRHVLPFHNMPQGGTFSSQPGHITEKEYYNSQQFTSPMHEGTQRRPGTHRLPMGHADVLNSEHELDPDSVVRRYEGPRDYNAPRDSSGGRVNYSAEKGPETASPTLSATARRAPHSTCSARTSSGGGTRREQQLNLKEQTRLTHTSKSPLHLRTDSSKSSPPYTLSQRKQHRVEEKSYLKEVKRSIAEGRVPQVRLQQDDLGDIVQYKAQFLNALKLAALALVPNANIDVKNTSIMQEIMREVKKQFIIEKPLPEGMVAGYLQRLYKRNRAMYHRHWTVHGDHRKPDDCSSAAWLQLVDYWKSEEGSKECERNKANASAKKPAAEKLKNDNLEQQKATGSEEVQTCSTFVHPKLSQPKRKEVVSKESALSRRPLASQTSKISSPIVPSERPPMLDISNKLHALVDEFVSHLSSECDTLAHNVSSQPHIYLAHDSATEVLTQPKLSNRIAAEVLSGLKRPSAVHVLDSHRRQGKSPSDKRMATSNDVNSRTRDDGRNSQTVELLSSDHSSDDFRRPAPKSSKKLVGNLRRSKVRNSSSRSSSPGIDITSPQRSRKSSPVLDYGYEGDTKGFDVEATFHKLRWPQEPEDSEEDGGLGKPSDNNVAHCNRESSQKKSRPTCADDVNLEDGDESTEDDTGRHAVGNESSGEDLPVIPKVPVKRRLVNEARAQERGTQRGKAKSTSPQIKKPKTPQIDASVITQLEFSTRPANSNPIRVKVKVWILHPKFEGKVVAEAYAGINHKSRCLNDEQDLCKKGEQMISMIRVFYKDTPVMFKKDVRYPKHIGFLDQAEGLPNCQILWGVSYIIPIPSLEEITRMMGNVTTAVCGRASSSGIPQGQKGKNTTSPRKKGNNKEAGKVRDTILLRNRTENTTILGRPIS